MMVVFALISLFFVGISLYLAALTVAAFLFKKSTDGSARPLKLAVVIPAHNEALQIRATVEAVHRSGYPKNCYRAIVIADNCEDETAAVAEGAGAQVLVRSDPIQRGKGQALDWFLREQQDAYAAYDGIAIIDADTVVDENFLREISASLAHPEVYAAQAYYGVSNATESWRTALMSAALCVFHHVRPAGRNRLGGSAGLKGNGMAFRTEILKKFGWPAHSVVEDLEFGAQLLLDGICVYYNPDAIVRAEMAGTRKQAETQRKRWEGGRLQILGKYARPLLQAWARQRRFRFFDGFMDLLIPPLSALVLALGVLFVCAFIAFPQMMPFIVCAALMVIFYVLSGLILKKAPLAVWLYLAAAPFFILWKIPLYLGMLRAKGGNQWVRTQRKAELHKKD
jgi:cellulose synthase/poly-beta-1,6-N-acetylglucosamine synthase-like glycosyltransferase